MNLKNTLYVFLSIAFAVIIYTFAKIIFIAPYVDKNLNNKNITFIITPNSSLKQIARDLHYSGILKNPLIFRILVKLTGNEHKIKAGEYDFFYSNSMIEI
ncbi:endolytic transglycosylase MltG [Candidatus Desantisbacteria bacterium]|nr:endolytic transglycosylase MltG [Candidatus Desantisbacteria bacterium]